MIKILNSANETQAILENVTNPVITEEINREFNFSFTTVIDGNKSDYVNYQNKVEVEDNYFNIVYTEEERTQEGLFIRADCEHVSYDLIDETLTSGFTATGLFSAVATTLLSGTSFSIGTNEITASDTISINESTNKRYVLMQLADLYGGELEFDKYTINLLTRRGADRGIHFRYRKNLIGVKRIVDNRNKVSGSATISYSVSAAELEFERGFISSGLSGFEHYELGDTITVYDDNLNINTQLRIVKESHDTEQRMNGTVELSNFVDNITDTIKSIQTTQVSKDSIYNGTSIGPENGFVAERSDSLVKTTMNATNGIEIDLRASTTASYTPVFYVTVDTAAGTANLYLAGNAILTGEVAIGSGNNIFKADSNGIYLGNATFASAPFRVTMTGALTATAATITGTINATAGSFSGTISASGTISGSGEIVGATVTGGLIRTSSSGERLELTNDSLKTYNSSGNLNGPTWGSAGNTYGDMSFYDDGTEVLRIQNALLGQGYSFISQNGAATIYVDPVFSGTVDGAGTTLAYDTATNTLSLKDGTGATLSSVVIP